MKKLLLSFLFALLAIPAMALEDSAVKLSLWDKIAVAFPASIEDISGVEFGIGSTANEVNGVQMDLLFAQTEYELNGVSLGFVSMGTKVKGWQSGLFAKSMEVTGLQSGLVTLTQAAVTGVQFGFYNQAEYIRGVQLGIVNYARTVEGLQIGLLNIAQNGWMPAMVLVNGRF